MTEFFTYGFPTIIAIIAKSIVDWRRGSKQHSEMRAIHEEVRTANGKRTAVSVVDTETSVKNITAEIRALRSDVVALARYIGSHEKGEHNT